MRAVGFKEFGDPEVLEVMDIPEVYASQGEIRIKNPQILFLEVD